MTIIFSVHTPSFSHNLFGPPQDNEAVKDALRRKLRLRHVSKDVNGAMLVMDEAVLDRRIEKRILALQPLLRKIHPTNRK